MQKHLGLLATIVAMLAAPSVASAFEVQPGVFDPDHTGNAVAAWTAGAGLPDEDAPSANYGLVLQKNAPTSANLAAGADIVGRPNGPLTALGFDVKQGGACGAGAPRFNVFSGSDYWFFGCAYGTHTAAAPGWDRVTFGAADGIPAGNQGPLTSSTVVDKIEIVQDEQGQTTLDNIRIDGETQGNPAPPPPRVCHIIFVRIALLTKPIEICI
jgi:hypothetical protein